MNISNLFFKRNICVVQRKDVFFSHLEECRSLFPLTNHKEKREGDNETANSIASQTRCFSLLAKESVHCCSGSFLVHIFQTSGPLTLPFPPDHTPVHHHHHRLPTLLHLNDAHSRTPLEVKEPVDVAPSQRLTHSPPSRQAIGPRSLASPLLPAPPRESV